VLAGSSALIAAGLLALIVRPPGACGVMAAFVAGFGTGPVYPLALAMVLRRRETVGVFVLAGVGSAVLPLATGTVSGHMHSLAAGLCVPLGAAVVMCVLGWRAGDSGLSLPHPSRDEAAQ
jgi:fucose permease